MDISICMTYLLWCTTETNTTFLSQLYLNKIKLKKKIKISLFVDDMILQIENPNTYTQLERMS